MLGEHDMNVRSTSDEVPLRRWVPPLVSLGGIWGCSFLFIAVGVRELHPIYVSLGRVVIGATVLVVILVVRGQAMPRSLRLWGHCFVLGAVGAAVPFTLFGYGGLRIPSLLAGIWDCTTALITLPLAILVFRTERFSAYRVIGLLVGFIGMLVVLGAWRIEAGADLVGQLFCLGAAACYAIAISYQRRYLVDISTSALALSAASLLTAAAQLAIVGPVVAHGLPRAPWSLSIEVIGSVIALGVLGSALAFVLNLHNIRLIGASAASTATYLIPVFSVAAGVLVLGEELTWYQPVGAMIVIAGVSITQRMGVHGAQKRGPVL
jgi:drug/metabolite transporter (DMT)-like permease